jgi:hypothetical protein
VARTYLSATNILFEIILLTASKDVLTITIRKEANMKANLGTLDRTIRIILGVILLSISFVVPMISPGPGKVVVSIIGVILVVTGAISY